MGNNSSDDDDDEDNLPPPTLPVGTETALDEMPRWRFIAKAKKTEGYSSASAGRVVEGELLLCLNFCGD